jgi:hypothetical protein
MECQVANCANGFVDDNGTHCPTCNGTGRVYPLRIQWRLNDPAAEDRERWTRSHVTETGRKTRCGLSIPEVAYMTNEDDQIGAGVLKCLRCGLVS